MFPRRHSIRIELVISYLFTALFILVVNTLAMAQAGETSTRPNIVVVMADDLGFSDLGCYGSEIETPRLDELAAQGLRMTQFYNTAKCHSSRVSLLTGLYCDQAGAESLSRGTTVARQLQEAGYFTAMVGKWHLHDEPTDHGFQRYFGHLSGATNFFTGDDTFRLNGQPWNSFGNDFYTTIANTDFAIQFVDEHLQSNESEAKPFFMYMAYNAPHYPLHALKEDFEKYRETYQVGWDQIRAQRRTKQKQLGLFDETTITDLGRPHYIPAWDDLPEEQKVWESDRMAAYAGMVDRLDREIGRFVDHLKAKGQLENTLILFVSDNGACPFERTRRKDLPPYDSQSYWTYDTGWAHVGNTPFRYYKQNNHEGGIASPAIVHWPAVMNAKSAAIPGSIETTPAHLIDIMATCLDLAGGEYPSEVDGRTIEPLMGRSIKPILEGKPATPHPYLYFHFASNRGLRVGDWKLASLRSGPWELYHLAEDRNEAVDRAQEFPEIVEEMATKWHSVAETIDRVPAKFRKPVSDKPKDSTMKKTGNSG